MPTNARLGELADDIGRLTDRDAKSLVVTIFGDAVLPHGGEIWLGSLIRLMEPFGADDRVVRTSIFRLTREGWFSSSQIGRRRFYALTDSGTLHFQSAHARIYAGAQKPWNGSWTIVFTGLHDAAAREPLRRDLAWQGFGQLLPGVLLHPSPDAAALRQALKDAAIPDALVMQARAESFVSDRAIADVIASSWDLERLAFVYARFLATFRPVLRELHNAEADPETAFRLRISLVHAYRRALLRDPLLPDELLQKDWPGAEARALCRDIYRRLQFGAERHFLSVAETSGGPMPKADAAFEARFDAV